MRTWGWGIGVALLALGVASTAGADGAWTSYVRATGFTDLLAEGDTILCATSDAGLLSFTPSRRAFEFTLKEPSGLARNGLTALEFDARHRLWIGTRGSGVSVRSADGARWSLVNVFDGLPSDTVNTLTAEGDSMWIGTTAGLAVWDGQQLAGVLPDGVNPSPFASDFITGIVPLGDSLWVGTRAGVYVARSSTGLVSWTLLTTGLASPSVARLVSDGRVPFALAGASVRRWDPDAVAWLSTGDIGAVYRLTSRRGILLAASDAGIFRWTGAAWSVVNASLPSTAGNPMATATDPQGAVCAAGRPANATDGSASGLYRQSGGGWEFDFPPGPTGNNCLNLEIENGRVYVTTYDQGVARLRDGEWTCWFPHPVPDTSRTQFLQPVFNFAMLADAGGYKWVYSWAPCSAGKGVIDILDDSGPTDVIRHTVLGPDPEFARRSFARASTLDRQGGHWFGMDSPCGDIVELGAIGLEYYRPDTTYGGNFNTSNVPEGSLLSDQIWSLATDRNNRVWVGANRGLSHFDPALGGPATTMQLVSGTSLDLIRALATHSDSLWVLTPSELRQYSLVGRSRGSYTLPGGPSVQALRPMDVGLDGTLWLGTASGVRAYHPGGPAEDFTSANSPLLNDDVHTIRVDSRTGEVWMATGGGISRYNPYYVPVTAEPGPLSFQVYPNPAHLTNLGVPIRLTGSGSAYEGQIYDLNGRKVRRFKSPVNGGVVWDGKDEHGELVRPGIYFVRAESAGRSAVQRVVVLR